MKKTAKKLATAKKKQNEKPSDPFPKCTETHSPDQYEIIIFQSGEPVLFLIRGALSTHTKKKPGINCTITKSDSKITSQQWIYKNNRPQLLIAGVMSSIGARNDSIVDKLRKINNQLVVVLLTTMENVSGEYDFLIKRKTNKTWIDSVLDVINKFDAGMLRRTSEKHQPD